MTISKTTPGGGRTGPAIVVFIGTQAIGDYIMHHMAAASVAREFPGARMGVIYRDDRPYKTFINGLNPYVTAVMRIDENPDIVVPIDWFDGDEGEDGKDGRNFSSEWIDNGLHRPDLFLTPDMLNMNACIWPPPAFLMPPEVAAPLAVRLKSMGVREDGWFVCLHARERGSRYRQDSDLHRNVDPDTYLPMIDDIINEQGGQVIRLGHPGSLPLTDRDGLIDLSRIEDSFDLQAFAISRARYFIGSDSGPTQMAAAFKTPAATTNAMGIGIWNDGDVALLKTYAAESGSEELSWEELYELLPVMGNRRPVDYMVKDNGADEIIEVARHMFEMTADCPGWRKEAAPPPYDPSGSITLPLQWRFYGYRADLTFWNERKT